MSKLGFTCDESESRDISFVRQSKRRGLSKARRLNRFRLVSLGRLFHLVIVAPADAKLGFFERLLTPAPAVHVPTVHYLMVHVRAVRVREQLNIDQVRFNATFLSEEMRHEQLGKSSGSSWSARTIVA